MSELVTDSESTSQVINRPIIRSLAYMCVSVSRSINYINAPQVHVAETIYTCNCPCPSYSAKHCPTLSDTHTHQHTHICENIQSSQPASQLINCSLTSTHPFHQPTDRPIYRSSTCVRPTHHTITPPPPPPPLRVNQFAPIPDSDSNSNSTPVCASQPQDIPPHHRLIDSDPKVYL